MNEKKRLGYGLVSVLHLELIVDDVSSVLGGGANDVAAMAAMEVCAQETLLGAYPDKSIYGQGAGIFQFDRIGFVDTRKRVRDKDRQKIIEHYGIDVKSVQLRELDFNPLLSAIFFRLKYLKIPEPIPTTREGRAAYWKQHWNTESGKGTVEEYIYNANLLIYTETV